MLSLVLLGCSNLMIARSQTSAWLTSYAQVNMGATNQTSGDQARTLSSILSEARKAFDVDFIYESKVLPGAKLVIDVDKFKTVEEFLTELLRPYNLKYKKVLARAYVIYSNTAELKRLITMINRQDGAIPQELLHVGAAANERSIIVTGKILEDGKNTPLEGVSVTVKGSNRGTITDKDGNFRLEVENANAVLIFSLIGYQPKEVTVGSQTNFQIAMISQSQSLNDVVVVGYGTQKKSVVTGAISSVKASDLEDQPVYRLEQSLQGRASGLTIAASSGQPGAASTVRIRGTTSINGSDPLYVVDGVPLDGGGLDYLNQSDIESIEVLKDASSAAIYGARSAAGVILVTTKKGKAGTLRVSYNGYYGSQAPARKLHLLNATEYATLRNESSLAAGNGILFANPAALGKGTDWQSQIFNNNARIQDHELNFSGGTDKSTFFASFGYNEQQGIVATPISYYKRLTVRLNGDHKIKPWLGFGENIGYAYVKSQGLGNTNSEFGGPLSSAINLDPITPVVITDPAILNDPTSIYNTEPVIRDAQGRPYAISKYVGQEMTNPLAYIKLNTGNSSGWQNNFVGNGYMAIRPVKGLELRTSIGTKMAFYGSNSFNPIYYLNGSSSNPITNFYRESDQVFIYDWENTASYTRSIGLHNFTALVGTGAWKQSGNGVNGNFQNMPVTSLQQASLGYSIPNANKIANGFDNVDHTLSSEFARINYSYDDRYLLTAAARRDGSSRFGSNHKYGYFPGASVGWVVTRENFWPTNNTLNFLKIRGSYGETGSDNIGDFAYVSTISGGRNYNFGNGYDVGYSPNAPPNPDLKWEQTAQTDLGFDAVLFKDFNVGFDIYDKKTTGMLQTIQLPLYIGASGQPSGNIASMTNKGMELELGYNKKVGEVNLSLKGNVSLLRNRVTSLGITPYKTGATFQSSAYEISRTAPGYAIASFYGFQTLGIFQTQADINNYVGKNGQKIQPNAKPGDFKWADLDGDGAITSSDRTFIGDPTPKYGFGFTAGASWKNFDILVFGQGAGGNKIFQGLRRLDIATANYQAKALGRWTGPGTSNDFPRLVDGDPNKNFANPSSFELEDGSYFRIKTLQIGYSLPQSLIRKYTLQKVRIYVSGFNLITFTKYTGYDPEIGGSSYGIDRGFYPQARSLQAGLSVGF
jgi:TonB-linked SusC/RagA family outer membrane protein